MNLNFEQRKREVRRYANIRRNFDLEKSTIPHERNKISTIASELMIPANFYKGMLAYFSKRKYWWNMRREPNLNLDSTVVSSYVVQM